MSAHTIGFSKELNEQAKKKTNKILTYNIWIIRNTVEAQNLPLPYGPFLKSLDQIKLVIYTLIMCKSPHHIGTIPISYY